ncbi:hypothetical protein [Aquibacillus sediminis]|uniref:hypothetical protein n=1 Tax=Aquibacillus sediminis TaxID=2574734 RepID=UPI001107C5DB|nr:hypothetical protein [Aquibacillus sediminis]
MRKVIIIVLISMCIIFVGGYASINLYTKAKLDHVEENVTEHNPEITKVVSINSIGQWGEWFSEYSLVVLIEGEKYRVWTSGDGEITDKMPVE